MGATKVNVWSGSQKKLFRKYTKDRTASIKQIEEACEELKEDLGLD